MVGCFTFPTGEGEGGGASQGRECVREDKHAGRNTNPANVENKHTQTAV